jgi:hypothetical protein
MFSIADVLDNDGRKLNGLLFCRKTNEPEVHIRTMKMYFLILNVWGFVQAVSWGILIFIKQGKIEAKTGGGFTPSLPHPQQDIH